MTNATKLKIEIKAPLTQEEIEQRMRLIANLIIDRMLEDKKSNKLMFKSSTVGIISRDNLPTVGNGKAT